MGDPSSGDEVPRGFNIRCTLRGDQAVITRLAWSPDGRMLASGAGDSAVRIWDAETGKAQRTFTGQSDIVYSVAWSIDGLLASGAGDHTIRLWRPETGEQGPTLQGYGHDDRVFRVTWSPDGQTLASGSADNSIRLWDAKTGKQRGGHYGHYGGVNDLAWSPDGRRLASGSYDQWVRMWSVEERELGWKQLLWQNKGHTAIVNSLAWSPDGRMLTSGADDSIIRIWDPDTGRPMFRLEGHTASITGVAFSADSRLLASKSKDNTVRLWRTDHWETVAILPEVHSTRWEPGLAFHPKEQILATLGERDKVVRIWKYDLSLSQTVVPVVNYTSAKVVLVGESNIGKSYLAHRVGTGAAPEEGAIQRTHGMKFWPMAPEKLSPDAVAPEGQRRDVVLWDMGGQEEYRLIHQLFLHDTTVALVLIDPTRGGAEFQNVETWNKYLEKQLRGRPAVKLLVGTKMDRPSDTVDRRGLERLKEKCEFAGYYETSALNGRGVPEFCAAVARAIDWDNLGKTSRSELFQRIRDLIEDLRKRGDVVLHVSDLHRALSDRQPTDEEEKAVNAVSEQLAAQGVIARSRVATGEPVLVLQVQEIERYGGSLIIAARENPRGVPALEVARIGRPDFVLPGIAREERLPRTQELPVLECTVRLLVEHGICFEHEGLLIFPTCFGPPTPSGEERLPRSASLYYDFSGAIDNIYASLIAWLVLARNFGRVRLWADRAEFEVGDKGHCGLRKISRPGGFAHVEVYFEAEIPVNQRKLFIDFVEQHLREWGVEITERISVPCPKGFVFDEETLRIRIAEGARDVLCPRCEVRHVLTEDAETARRGDPGIRGRTWALKTEVEERRKASAGGAVKVLERSVAEGQPSRPIRILHLSDLHFTAETPVAARLQWLVDDLRKGEGWGGSQIERLDYLVVSGDFTDRGNAAGFEKAYEFVSAVASEFGLSAERCIFVPGNHDVTQLREAYEWRENAAGLKDGDWVQQGSIVLARNAEEYPLRFKPFSDFLFHKFFQRPYPTSYAEQGMAIPFWETGIQFIALNSCWQIDKFYPKRSGVFPEAVANAIRTAQKQETDGRNLDQLTVPLLRIAVWHHAVAGPEQMKDTEFLGHLQNNGVRLALHGDVHELRRDLVSYWRANKLYVVGSGSFGAYQADRPEATPRLYNLLEIDRDLRSARIHTRCQPRPDASWKGWNEWPNPNGEGAVPYYSIDLSI